MYIATNIISNRRCVTSVRCAPHHCHWPIPTASREWDVLHSITGNIPQWGVGSPATPFWVRGHTAAPSGRSGSPAPPPPPRWKSAPPTTTPAAGQAPGPHPAGFGARRRPRRFAPARVPSAQGAPQRCGQGSGVRRLPPFAIEWRLLKVLIT